jgi:molecular chaperone GrpE (heat shock protein)
MLDPFIRDVIALCDTCHRNAQAWLAKPDATPEDIHRVLTDVAGDVSLILDRQGVETFTPDRGERFDRGRHRAARTEPTDDAERDSTVAEALRPGYLRGARVIRFADVTVFRYLRASADE